MNKAFIVSGGAGRVAAMIPAFEKFHRLNPENDFKILAHGWSEVFWSHPDLQKRVVLANQKGCFETHIKEYDVVCPEPYILNNFFNERINLVEAFDEIINRTTDHSDLARPKIVTSQIEKLQANQIINDIRNTSPQKKIVLFQPFGSSCQFVNNYPFDETHRSVSPEDYVKIVNGIKDLATVIYCSNIEFKPNDDDSIPITNWSPYLRVFPALLEQCDYFIGCDSCGQHFAYGLNVPGTIVMGGSTNNFTYPHHFKVCRKTDTYPQYNPIRLSESEIDFANRANDGIINLSETELDELIHIIRLDLLNQRDLND